MASCAASRRFTPARNGRRRHRHIGGETSMKEKPVRLGPREQKIAELLLQGCDNKEIARQLKMAKRTVKAHFNRLFLRFGISGGIKRVKLATLLYRRQLCSEANVTGSAFPANENRESLSLSLKDSKTAKSPMPLAPPNTSLKTIYASSTTNSGSGTKLDDTKPLPTREVLELWERSILNLDPRTIRGRHPIEQ